MIKAYEGFIFIRETVLKIVKKLSANAVSRLEVVLYSSRTQQVRFTGSY